MLLHNLPAVNAPKPVIFWSAIFLAFFFFYFTKPETPPATGPSAPVT